MINWMLDRAAAFKERFDRRRLELRWAYYRSLGMNIGESVYLPPSTSIDTAHAYLISIGNNCGFGPDVLILAHDAQMDEFLDAGRIGRVIIHESCHIGARSVLLAGIEIGPRTIVGANSVVSKSLPPDTVCMGSPAKVVCSLQEYLEKHRANIASQPSFLFRDYNIHALTPERRAELLAATRDGDAYIAGGHTAELEGWGGTPRTEVRKVKSVG